jgi:peptidoglycan/LPS O-acetylase OafA/YrhL
MMRRVAELDSIRGLAALSILIYHLRPEISFGWTRVDLFLVLSGYLVTSIILKYHATRGFLPVFFARRAIRIWPVYFLVLLAVVVVNPLLPNPFPMDGLPYYLTFTQNVPRYWSRTIPPFNHFFSHTWTLAVEEQFYLVWPAVVCLAGRRRLIPLAGALAAASVAARAAGFHPWLLAARCDGLALGGLLAALLADRERVRRHLGGYRRGFGLVALGALAFLAWTLSAADGRDFHDIMSLRPALTVFASNVFYFGVVGLLICGSGHPALGLLRGRRLAYLGSISYGIYLYHPMVFAAITLASNRLGLSPSSWGLDAVKFAAAIAVAALSWECFERPLLALKERVPYRKTSDAVPGLPAMPSKTGVVAG